MIKIKKLNFQNYIQNLIARKHVVFHIKHNFNKSKADNLRRLEFIYISCNLNVFENAE